MDGMVLWIPQAAARSEVNQGEDEEPQPQDVLKNTVT